MKRLLLPTLLLLVPIRLHAQTPEQKEFFETRIRPLLAQQCFVCHTNSKMGGLRLDSIDDMLKGGEHGPAVVPGDPEKSLLIASVRHSGELKMPKGAARLMDAQIGDLTSC
jgi:cytochrome c